MNLVRSIAALLLCGLVTLPAAAGAQGLRPKSLLIYYGYPTSINSTFAVPAAAAVFGSYDYVVWGDGLDNPAHADHANAVAIIAHAATAATRIYGYVDLGVSTQNLSMAEIQLRLQRWDAMGVDGVLLDDFGYDYGTARARQNQAVAYAHGLGLAVIANAFRPEDAFGTAPDATYTPSGVATMLGASDFYLYESHGVRLGEFEDAAAWQQKADALEAYRSSLGFRVLSITTTATDGVGAYDAARFFYAWHAALLFGHAATGWGEYGFSASGASNGQAPFRTRPVLDPGAAFTAAVVHGGSLHTRRTDLGRIELDTAAHTWGFSAAPVGVPALPGPAAVPLSAAPNPVRLDTRIGFELERAQAVRLAVFDAGGRRVATIAGGELAAGRHERVWSGRDASGRRAPAGSYFVALEAAGRRSATRVVLLP